MKNKTVLIPLALVGGMLLTACGGSAPQPTPKPSGEKVTYSFVDNAYLVNARFPGNVPEDTKLGNERDGFGMYWTEEGWEFQENIEDEYATYARIVVNAEFAYSEFPISYTIKGFDKEYRIRTYANTKDPTKKQEVTIDDPSYSWGTTEVQTDELKYNLKKGKNVILVQVIDWGSVTKFTLPKELTVVKPDGGSKENGIYKQNDFIFQATRPVANTNILDADAEFKYGGCAANSNPSYEGAAILNFKPKSTTKSLDVKFKVESFDGESAALGVRVGNDSANSFAVDVSSSAGEATVHLPSYKLSENGFAAGQNNTVRFTSNIGKVQILQVSESTQQDQEPSMVTIDAAGIKANTLVRGRSANVSNAVAMDWTSSGIEFDITGGGDITCKLDEIADHFNQKGTAAMGNRVAVEIDGKFSRYIKPGNNVEIASGLSAAKHHVALYKVSEACGGILNLVNLKVSENAVITKGANKAYKFEILGDSITCGNQIAYGEENGYNAYTTKIAKAYNANLNALSVSGRGLKLGYNCEEGWPASWNNQINSIWDKTSFFRDGGTASFDKTSYVPDVVIANLGNNDLGDYIMQIAPMTIDEFTDEVVDFSGRLRAAYPNAKILWVYGAFVNRKYEAEYRAAVEGIGDSNIKFLYLDKYGGGADDHPNDAQHTTIAKKISEQISSMLGIADPMA